MVRVSRRGQLVLATAAVLAAALAPVLLAYLQLGYHADAAAMGDLEDPTADAHGALQRAVHEASRGVPANHSWADRRAAADRVRADLAPRIETLEAARVEKGTHVRVRYNATAATARAAANCPRGDGRRFGACRADGGVVLQERAGDATPLAVAFDLTVTRERGVTRTTVVVHVR